ncbi:MAG: flagellar motor switch protein FliN [Gammaproteobacteria bacterium]|nr:flagellar motor switch protein FliN [Rhodocyclaceae bacterium]MBU3909536.1 flagellar motor switch protein FliN [Gammaproteobacteria bacterium]MBU3987938.1 flagellar motor switch protein FliN [Gammaproteobacteria bacterium]MBU4003199.1 flagellar motor switch protein FliN [Gammaproteobacteria bacterium]MBU4022248.1 flagellar motor switch protein FliN [Gammaproteobacteria bacterium]
MNDEVKQEEAQVTDDDWAAAMGEQAVAEGTTAADDDWAAAMGEQAAAEKSANAAAPAKVFEQFSGAQSAPASNQGFELILDIPVSLTVELGRTKISIRNLLQLAHGSVVELDGLAGEPMDVLINGTLIAQGEVVVVNEKFGIRLTDIITPQERVRKLNK